MIALAAVLTIIAWTVGPLAFTIGLILFVVGLCTDSEERMKLRKTRLRQSYLIMGISVAAMFMLTLFAVLLSAIGY